MVKAPSHACRWELPPSDGEPTGVLLQGTVRHAAVSPDGTMHVGIEVSPDQSAVVVVKVTEALAAALVRV